VTFVDAINVNDNKMVFSAGNRALVQMLKQEKKYGAQKFFAKFTSKPWTLPE